MGKKFYLPFKYRNNVSKFYKTKTIYEPIYDSYLTFIVSNDRVKLVKKHGVDLFDDYAQSSKTPKKVKGISKRGYTLIFCGESKVTPLLFDIITHEADHIRDFIMEDIGEDAHWVSESKAYLAGWIARELSKFILTK